MGSSMFRKHRHGKCKPSKKERERRQRLRRAQSVGDEKQLQAEREKIERMCPSQKRIIRPGQLFVRQGHEGNIIIPGGK